MFSLETQFAVIRLRFAFSTIIRRIGERKNCIFNVPLNCQISISRHQIKHRLKLITAAIYPYRHVNVKSKLSSQRCQYFPIPLSETRICAVFRASIIGRSVLQKDYSFSSIWERPLCAPRTVTNVAIKTDWLDLKIASAYKAMSAFTCITNHSLKELYSTYTVKC